MICPKCDGKVRVKDVRHSKYSQDDFRQRECKECGYIFYTVEAIEKFDEKFKRQWRLRDRGLERRNNYEAEKSKSMVAES